MHEFKEFHVPALVGADGNPLGVFLDRRIDNLVY